MISPVKILINDYFWERYIYIKLINLYVLLSGGQQMYLIGMFSLLTDEARETGGRVLVHCQAGVSRSPTIVIAYLMKHTRMTMVDSYKFVKSRRLIISPNLNFMGQLVEWETALQASKAEADCKPCHECQWQRQETVVKKVPNACQV